MVLVADVANKGLVGTDFLRAHWIIMDFAANKAMCDGDPVIARYQEGSNQTKRVSVAEIVVLARTQMIQREKL